MDTNISRQLGFLVQQNTGVKLEKVIEQILESNLYNTNDFLENENVKALTNSNKHYNTLLLFTKQNYLDYKNKKENFIELSSKMLMKLKIITILDFVKEKKNVGLDILSKVLDITDPFELDNLIFEAFSLGLISGKVDQKNKILKVLSVKGRDYIPDMSAIEAKLDKWIDNLEKSSNYLIREVECLRNETNVFGEHLHKNVSNVNKLISGSKIILLIF